jgi:hypothetical protein
MAVNDLNRVVFYSIRDGASGSNLVRAGELLDGLVASELVELNDLLEIYHIKQYFDNGMFLHSWDEKTLAEYKSKVNEAFEKTRSFFRSITDDDMFQLVDTLSTWYRKSFWYLFSFFQTFKSISRLVFVDVLQRKPHHIHYVLYQKPLVDYYNKELKDFLIGYPKAAELLLQRYETPEDNDRTEHFFPQSLSAQDKEKIMLQYISGPDPNLNYLQLIQLSNAVELKLTQKVRFTAKKKAEELNNELLSTDGGIETGVQISIHTIQDIPVQYSYEGNILKITYSLKYLEQQKTAIEHFRLFDTLFGYLDEQKLIPQVSKESELLIMESVAMKSKNEYVTGFTFERKRMIALGQLGIFHKYLKADKGIGIENLIDSFIKDRINTGLNGQNIRFHLPTDGMSYLEKIRVLAPEFEFLLRQYDQYLTDGHIDFEFLQFSSSPVNFSDLRSANDKKYLYIADDSIHALKFQFFSDQSSLFYTPQFGDKYHNLYDLLVNEDVPFEAFANYQQTGLTHLIESDYLELDPNNMVRIKQSIKVYLIGILYESGVLHYWSFPDDVQEVMDQMIVAGELSVKKKLFCDSEVNFLNFYLNKKQYSNGLDLRNKYLHGTNTSSEGEQELEYLTMLMLVVLVLLKIEVDISIAEYER